MAIPRRRPARQQARVSGLAARLLWGLSQVVGFCLGSILGLATVATFAVFALAFLAQMPVGVAVTLVAVSMNAMLLSLLLLGSLLPYGRR